VHAIAENKIVATKAAIIALTLLFTIKTPWPRSTISGARGYAISEGYSSLVYFIKAKRILA
jgi:hypothetical protein